MIVVQSFENRDLKCAGDVSIMASLGRFDTEFLLYGSAVQEKAGHIYYYATTNQTRLYQRIKEARAEERYFMPMVYEKKRTAVPSGMKDALLSQYKLALIQRMKRVYDALLPQLQPFFQCPPNDNAYALLCAFQDEVDGYFDDAKLQLFRGLVEMSYEGKILSIAHYRAFCAWLEKVRMQMNDDPVTAGNITRVFYGFAYDDHGVLRHLSNAQEMALIEKRQALQLEGHLVAPIVKRQYAMSQSREIGAVRKSFNTWLQEIQDETFMQWVKILRAMDGVIDMQALDALAATVENQSEACLALDYYRAIWNGRKVSSDVDN